MKTAFASVVVCAICCVICAPSAWGIAAPEIRAKWSSIGSGRPITVGDLLSLRDVGGRASGILLSPDHSALAFQVRQADVAANRYRISWEILQLPNGPIARGVDGGDLITSVDEQGIDNGNPADPVAHWSPDSRWIAYLRKTAGAIQVWRSSRDGRTQEQVTKSDGDVVDFGWLATSKLLAYSRRGARADVEAAIRKDREEGFLWDDDFYPVYSRSPARVAKGSDLLRVVEVGKGVDRVATADEIVAFRKSQGGRIDISTVAGTSLGAGAEGPAIRSPSVRSVVRFGQSSRLGALEARDPSLQGYRPPLTVVAYENELTSRPIVCSSSVCTGRVLSLFWDESGRRLIFVKQTSTSADRIGIYAWRLGDATAKQILITDDWIGNDCVVVAERALCLHETPTNPRRIVAISLLDGSIATLYDPNPAFAGVRFPAIEKLNWTDTYGNPTFAHLLYPLEYRPGERYPVVIVQYRSRGFIRGGTGGEYPAYALAAQGFFVLSWDRPDFTAAEARSSIEDLTIYTYQQNREHIAKQSALDTALDHLVQRGLIDEHRIGITGLSDGAETSRMALLHSERIATAIISTSAGDPITYYLSSRNGRANLRRWIEDYSAPYSSEAARKYWNYQSIALNIDHIRAPILMNLADSEMLNGAQAIAALQDSKKPLEVWIYPGAFHIKNSPKQLEGILNRNLDWMNFWLRGVEDGAAGKSEQYERWRELRARQQSLFPSGTAH